MTQLLVLRHGPTDWNDCGLIQGRADRPLSARGRAQVASWRLPNGWAAAPCLSSPLARAMETARLLGLAPRAEPRLIEMDWGEWEGRSLADLRAEHGEAMARDEAQGLDFRPPGGESPRDVQRRLGPLFGELSGRTILVTHKGVLRALYALATGWTMGDDPPEKLRDGRAHVFDVGQRGSLTVRELNIRLTSP